MNKNYKEMWVTYKQELIDDFKSMCKEVVHINLDLEELKIIPIPNTVVTEKKKHRLSNYKLQWQAAINILKIIDRIDDTATVADLSEIHIYKETFEIFGLSDYNYYKLPINQFIADTRTYEDKWEELSRILMNIVKNTEQHNLIEKEVLYYIERQLDSVLSIENRYK